MVNITVDDLDMLEEPWECFCDICDRFTSDALTVCVEGPVPINLYVTRLLSGNNHELYEGCYLYLCEDCIAKIRDMK